MASVRQTSTSALNPDVLRHALFTYEQQAKVINEQIRQLRTQLRMSGNQPVTADMLAPTLPIGGVLSTQPQPQQRTETGPGQGGTQPSGKRVVSKAARERMRAAQKARWAAIHAGKTQGQAKGAQKANARRKPATAAA